MTRNLVYFFLLPGADPANCCGPAFDLSTSCVVDDSAWDFTLNSLLDQLVQLLQVLDLKRNFLLPNLLPEFYFWILLLKGRRDAVAALCAHLSGRHIQVHSNQEHHFIVLDYLDLFLLLYLHLCLQHLHECSEWVCLFRLLLLLLGQGLLLDWWDLLLLFIIHINEMKKFKKN